VKKITEQDTIDACDVDEDKVTVLDGTAENNGGSDVASAEDICTIQPSCLLHHSVECEVRLLGRDNTDCDSYVYGIVTDPEDDDQCTVNIFLRHELTNVGVGCIELTSVNREIDWNGVPNLDLLGNIPSEKRQLCQGDTPTSVTEPLIRNINICKNEGETSVKVVVNNMDKCTGNDLIVIDSAQECLACGDFFLTLTLLVLVQIMMAKLWIAA